MPATPRRPGSPADSGTWTDLGRLTGSVAGSVAGASIRGTREVLDHVPEVPVAVAATAVAVAGLVDWPVAVGAVAGYAVLRRWGPLRVR